MTEYLAEQVKRTAIGNGNGREPVAEVVYANVAKAGHRAKFPPDARNANMMPLTPTRRKYPG
jgi:hypothetical protein